MIAIGIGANSRAHERDFPAALAEALHQAAGGAVVSTFDAAIFAIHVKAAAHQASVAYFPISLTVMRERSGDCLTRSERTLSLFGVASIAEATALAGAGPGSHLVMPRRIIGNITVAAAQSADARGQRE